MTTQSVLSQVKNAQWKFSEDIKSLQPSIVEEAKKNIPGHIERLKQIAAMGHKRIYINPDDHISNWYIRDMFRGPPLSRIYCDVVMNFFQQEGFKCTLKISGFDCSTLWIEIPD